MNHDIVAETIDVEPTAPRGKGCLSDLGLDDGKHDMADMADMAEYLLGLIITNKEALHTGSFNSIDTSKVGVW